LFVSGAFDDLEGERERERKREREKGGKSHVVLPVTLQGFEVVW
jgi:hypothetical protein